MGSENVISVLRTGYQYAKPRVRMGWTHKKINEIKVGKKRQKTWGRVKAIHIRPFVSLESSEGRTRLRTAAESRRKSILVQSTRDLLLGHRRGVVSQTCPARLLFLRTKVMQKGKRYRLTFADVPKSGGLDKPLELFLYLPNAHWIKKLTKPWSNFYCWKSSANYERQASTQGRKMKWIGAVHNTIGTHKSRKWRESQLGSTKK